jgi:hypothetical protein
MEVVEQMAPMVLMVHPGPMVQLALVQIGTAVALAVAAVIAVLEVLPDQEIQMVEAATLLHMVSLARPGRLMLFSSLSHDDRY